MERFQAFARSWVVPVTLLVLAAAIILLTPSEATIGDGIKIVAIHVALIWAGMLGLLLAGLIGVVASIRKEANVVKWMESIALVSLVLFALGVGTSLIAEIVNWGGIAWNEPRTQANLNLLAFSLIAQMIATWLGHAQVQGAIHLIVAVAVIWTTTTTELQLHPSGAVSSSPSNNIRLAFYSLTLLALMLGLWLAWFLQSRRPANTTG